MSKPRRRRRYLVQTESNPVALASIDKLPAECLRAATDVELLLAEVLGLLPDPYAWSDAQAQTVSLESDRIAVEIHRLVEARRHLRNAAVV